jgi:hypothetical protein
MILLTNEDLSFLNYLETAKSVSSGNAKTKLKITSENGKTYFSLFSNELIVISEIDKYESDFEVIVDVDDFCSVLKNIPDNVVINLDKNVVSFNETKYTFEDHPITLPEYKEYLEVIQNQSPSYRINNLPLNNNFDIALAFVGERDTSSVEYKDDHFIATNKVKACMLKNSDTSIDQHLIFSSVLCSFLSKIKLKSIDIDYYNNDSSSVSYYVIAIGSTYIISSIPENKLPNLFDDKFMKMYNHAHKIEVNKNYLLEALKRMRIVTKFDSISKAINFHAQQDKIILKGDDTNSSALAVETILASVDSDLINFYSRFNSAYLTTILNYIQSDNVRIYLSNNPEFLVAKITDTDEKNIFLLTRLHSQN